ncbi:6,7-dimethyl-8-ribityllumazine synthase [Candidatus Neomarinimicrobiota bacterium]
MGVTISGKLILGAESVAIVVSRFNSTVTQSLVGGAEDAFVRHGGSEANLTTVWVPGAFELPGVAKRLAASGKYAGIVVLGALIKGSTPHFDVLAQQVTNALVELSTTTSVPIAFGLLTTSTLEQALERAGIKAGNKGAEAMQSLIEMIDVVRQID